MEHTKTYLDYKKKANEKFVRYDEGAEMYHMGISKFMQIAKDAKGGNAASGSDTGANSYS